MVRPYSSPGKGDMILKAAKLTGLGVKYRLCNVDTKQCLTTSGDTWLMLLQLARRSFGAYVCVLHMNWEIPLLSDNQDNPRWRWRSDSTRELFGTIITELWRVHRFFIARRFLFQYFRVAQKVCASCDVLCQGQWDLGLCSLQQGRCLPHWWLQEGSHPTETRLTDRHVAGEDSDYSKRPWRPFESALPSGNIQVPWSHNEVTMKS